MLSSFLHEAELGPVIDPTICEAVLKRSRGMKGDISIISFHPAPGVPLTRAYTVGGQVVSIRQRASRDEWLVRACRRAIAPQMKLYKSAIFELGQNYSAISGETLPWYEADVDHYPASFHDLLQEWKALVEQDCQARGQRVWYDPAQFAAWHLARVTELNGLRLVSTEENQELARLAREQRKTAA
ncbi:hypothetical protein [Luteococcus peritonei]|uniref:Uncharacterized protein n=1 Tax=Luteococcus peritonei TaxID=88874 RepID=A0ABW4RVE2_9ACTN